METYDALLTRRSIRKYLKDPVHPDILQKIMTAALWAPSGSNTQPWRFYVASGKSRDELIQAMIDASGPEAPSMDAYDQLVERVDQIRAAMTENNTVEVGSIRSSEEGAKFIRYGSIRFYQAPVVIIVATPKHMGGSSHQSIGAAVQNILLAAHAEGLATCWLGMPMAFKDKIIQVLNIPDDVELVTTISLGYPDKNSAINKLIMPRLSFEEIVTYRS
ncbi:MAG: nitroreductase [Proteobacteria bacterium]|nr:nitroreductase [Pseudomonadota bacterium]MBU4472471.1 nitroreductase [Pseudomonadota bacterium]MCG2751298.1 nitroreductase [Desulfobacteraceae bacterium]